MIRSRGRAAAPALAPLLLGAGVLVAVALVGQDRHLLATVVSPPPLARLAAGVAAAALGIALLLRGLERLDPQADPATLIRGVRLLFLAVGAAAAALGWLAGIPVALVAALIVAGVDVVETSFLLLVTARHPREPERHERM